MNLRTRETMMLRGNSRRFGYRSPPRSEVLLCFAAVSFLVVGCGKKEADSASASFQQRLTAAQQVREPVKRAKALVRIAFQQAKARDERGAEETFRLAEEACGTIEDRAERVDALAFLVQARAKSGFQAQARRSLEQASKEVAAIDDPLQKAASLGQVALANMHWATPIGRPIHCNRRRSSLAQFRKYRGRKR